MPPRDEQLCPICRRRYHRMEVEDNGDLLYVHFEGELDGEMQIIGCRITDDSKIRGVRFRPDDRP